jgi:hypothetical protein
LPLPKAVLTRAVYLVFLRASVVVSVVPPTARSNKARKENRVVTMVDVIRFLS